MACMPTGKNKPYDKPSHDKHEENRQYFPFIGPLRHKFCRGANLLHAVGRNIVGCPDFGNPWSRLAGAADLDNAVIIHGYERSSIASRAQNQSAAAQHHRQNRAGYPEFHKCILNLPSTQDKES